MIATHLIFGCYGFWLPNDPHGSWSEYVRNNRLLEFGPATTVSTRQSLARNPHDVAQRLKAKEALQHQPVVFSGIQARAVAHGFAQAVTESSYLVFACVVMPDHAHLVVAEHKNPPRRIMGHLKGRATHQLNEEGLHPEAPNCWARNGWCVFLDTDDEVRRAIEYVRNNPIKEGLREQRWPFVTPYSR